MIETGLFISTAFTKQIVSLFNTQIVVDLLKDESNFRHLETLMPNIELILKKNKLSYSDLNYIAVDVGPGSFTGLRIGVATARALAQSLRLPIIGVSNLTAFLWNNLEYDIVVPFIDAKRKRVYGTVFQKEDNHWIQVIDYKDEPLEWFIQYVHPFEKSVLFIGNNNFNFGKLDFIFKDMPDIENYRVAVLDETRKTYNEIIPLYIRKSDAEIMKEKNE